MERLKQQTNYIDSNYNEILTLISRHYYNDSYKISDQLKRFKTT